MTSISLPQFSKIRSATRFTRERVEFGVRTDVAKDTLSTVKLPTEIEESTSNAIDHGTVSHLVVYSRDELWRAMLSFFSRQTDCRIQVQGVPSKRRLAT